MPPPLPNNNEQVRFEDDTSLMVIKTNTPQVRARQSTLASNAIVDGDIKQVFDQIARSIDLDEDYQQQAHSPNIGRPSVPDLNSPHSCSSTNTAATITSRTAFITPKSSPNNGNFLHLTTPIAPPQSPSNRLGNRGTTGCEPLIMNSPIPLISTKSFLDDDWLRERVKIDSKMAQVAGGLVRAHSVTPPLFETTTVPIAMDLVSSLGFGAVPVIVHNTNTGNHPPIDYICKLCNTPGHWLKDCHFYEPRGGMMGLGGGDIGNNMNNIVTGLTSINSGNVNGSNVNHAGMYSCVNPFVTTATTHIQNLSSASPTISGSSSSSSTTTTTMMMTTTTTSAAISAAAVNGQNRTPHPPGNYVCRLCGIAGHWIEQCVKFQPRKDPTVAIKVGHQHHNYSHPPKNYVCNLCHQPGHWIQHCSEFTPMPNHHHHHHHHHHQSTQTHRRSASIERNDRMV